MSDTSLEIQARGLSRRFREGGRTHIVLDGVDLDIRRGETVALRGRSGSGKSTLLNLIGGIDAPDAGTVTVTGVELTGLDERDRTLFRREHIGFVYQAFNLVPTLTVRENVLLPLELNGREDLAEQSLARLTTLGMAERQDDFPLHLSAGERQRTAIARALAHEPVLVLADEPTGNLDSENADLVADMLVSHARALGSALIIATHDEAIAERANATLRLGR